MELKDLKAGDSVATGKETVRILRVDKVTPTQIVTAFGRYSRHNGESVRGIGSPCRIPTSADHARVAEQDEAARKREEWAAAWEARKAAVVAGIGSFHAFSLSPVDGGAMAVELNSCNPIFTGSDADAARFIRAVADTIKNFK